jgi:branched-subunit amino acid transport protein
MECLKYVGAAVLPALIAPEVLLRDAPPGEVFNWLRIAAVLVAMLFALRTRSVFWTMVVGMAALLLFKWAVPVN